MVFLVFNIHRHGYILCFISTTVILVKKVSPEPFASINTEVTESSCLLVGTFFIPGTCVTNTTEMLVSHIFKIAVLKY